MKGVLMKVGQLVSFIAEGLPDEAQAGARRAAGRRRPDGADRSPPSVVARRARRAARAGVPSLGRPAGRRGEHRPGPPGRRRRTAARSPSRCSSRASARRSRRTSTRAEVMYACSRRWRSTASTPAASSTSCGRGCARSSTTASRRATSSSSPRHFAGHPWVRIPDARARAVDRSACSPPSGSTGMSWDEFLATRAAPRPSSAPARSSGGSPSTPIHRLGAFNGDPAPRQLPVPPRRQRDVPRLRARQALGRPASGSASSRASTPSSSHRDPERLVAAMEARRLPRRRPRPRPAARLRLRVEPVPAVPRRRVHVHPRLDARRRSARSSTSTGPHADGDRQAQHAAELRDPRPGRVGRQRDPRQARGDRPVAGDAARVPHRRAAGHRARRRRAGWRT